MILETGGTLLDNVMLTNEATFAICLFAVRLRAAWLPTMLNSLISFISCSSKVFS